MVRSGFIAGIMPNGRAKVLSEQLVRAESWLRPISAKKGKTP